MEHYVNADDVYQIYIVLLQSDALRVTSEMYINIGHNIYFKG